MPLSNDDNAKSAISNDASESVVQERTTDDAASQTTRVGQNETPKIIAAPLASRLADCVCEQVSDEQLGYRCCVILMLSNRVILAQSFVSPGMTQSRTPPLVLRQF